MSNQLAELATGIAKMISTLRQELGKSQEDNLVLKLAPNFLNLPLPEDLRTIQLRELTSSYMDIKINQSNGMAWNRLTMQR